jgi:integrase
MANISLTDRALRALKPAPKGRRYEKRDAIVPGLLVRVTETGTKTFMLQSRYCGSSQPTRRALGEYGAISLDQARKKARAWLELLDKGIDPAIEAERQKMAELRRQENSFAAVAEDFIRDKLPGERKGAEVERDIRRVFIPAWGKRPISDISPIEVRNLVVSFRDRPYQAHNLLGELRRLFNWAIDQQVYGLESSPCERIKPKAIIGEKKPRTRILSDAELRAAWKAADAIGYPYGPIFQLLMLTGARKSEVAEAHWREFDLDKALWMIPPGRMKSDAAHVVPLTDDAMAILKNLPRFSSGEFVFSTTFGKSPVNGFSKAKTKFDAAMETELGAALPPFVIHDLRRTVRTGLSALPGVSDLVRELVIGHTKPGLHKVYDRYAYLDEKRHALELWARRLQGIIGGAGGRVVPLRGAS